MEKINKKYIKDIKNIKKGNFLNKKSILSTSYTSILKFSLAVALLLIITAIIVVAEDIIVESGKVGIGGTSPSKLIHLYDTNQESTIRLETDPGAWADYKRLGGIEFGNTGNVYGVAKIEGHKSGGNDQAYLTFSTAYGSGNMGERMRITATGNVGIGKTDPNFKLDVDGDIRYSGYLSGFINLENPKARSYLSSVNDFLVRADERFIVTVSPGSDSGSLGYIFDGKEETMYRYPSTAFPVTIKIDFTKRIHYFSAFKIHFSWKRSTSYVKIEKYYNPSGGCTGASWVTVYENDSFSGYEVRTTSGLGSHICGFRITLDGTPDYAEGVRIGAISAYNYYYGYEGIFAKKTGDTIYGDLQVGSSSVNRNIYVLGNVTFSNNLEERFIKSSANGGAIRFRSNSGAATDRGLWLGRVDNNGVWSSTVAVVGDNVGIGTTTPSQKLDVNGQIHATGDICTDAGGGACLSSGGGGGVPSGVIVMWSGTITNIPSGWALCDGTLGTPDLRDKFVYGVSAGQNPGVTGGSTSHSHTVDAHRHSHNHPSTNTGGALNCDTLNFQPGAGSWGICDSLHHHSIDLPNIYSSYESPGTDSQNHLPPYYKIAFIMKL